MLGDRAGVRWISVDKMAEIDKVPYKHYNMNVPHCFYIWNTSKL